MALPTKSNKLFYMIASVLVLAQKITRCSGDPCPDCSNKMLGAESMNISYGPSNEHNCNCKWTIPETVQANDIAVVLLIQNISLPMTSGSGGSTDCSASIRFPGTDGHTCNFEEDCFIFNRKSSICNFNKIKSKIPNENHTRDAFKDWESAGNEILYNAGNFARYSKYFTIQYLVFDCSEPTTTPEQTTLNPTTQVQTTASTSTISATVKYSTSTGEMTEPTEKITRSSNESITSTLDSTKEPTKTGASSTTAISIIIPITVLLLLLIAALIILRYSRKKKLQGPNRSNKDSEARTEMREMVDNQLYGENTFYNVPETVVNESYGQVCQPNYHTEKVPETEPDVYAAVQKGGKKEKNTQPIEDGSNNDYVYAAVQKEPGSKTNSQPQNNEIDKQESKQSCVYAVVQKSKNE